MLSILIVEDEAIEALALKVTLENMGFLVTGMIATGELAVESVRGGTHDLILMDIALSGEMNGFETIITIRDFSNVPVIYMTGFPSEEMKDQMMKTGAIGFIEKPLITKDLQRMIRENFRLDGYGT
jgi:CheY-like chemotaxis protein